MLPVDRSQGALVGLAVGDAVGTTVEFRARGSFAPVTDMLGGGPFDLEPGEWTDDTSMALCLATSLVERGGFDAHDQMVRYCRWADEGYLGSNGTCFDMGNTVRSALDLFRRTRDPFAGATHERSAGNGSIMRLAPVVLYFAPDAEAVEHRAAESSRTTHGARECVDACRLFARILLRALEGRAKDDVLFAAAQAFEGAERITSIARGEYRDKREADIRGSGYVVESLEAALWCFHESDSFEEAVLRATNLGDDADTTAAVCGQVAGAFHGLDGIPARWRLRVAMREHILDLAEALHRAGRPR